jgi:hypothetical protein
MINAAEVINAPVAPTRNVIATVSALLGKRWPIAIKRGPKLAQAGNNVFNISGSPERIPGLLYSFFAGCHSQASTPYDIKH